MIRVFWKYGQRKAIVVKIIPVERIDVDPKVYYHTYRDGECR